MWGTYALIPASSLLVRSGSPALIAKLDFEQFGKILFVGCGAAEVALAAVVRNGLV
jgi:hypothetical protein